VLSKYGHDDVAYTLLTNDTFPSWGYMIKKGATSMWERWNGDSGDPAMNSFNHYAYGAVGEWMHRFLGGIDRSTGIAGFQRLVIRPRMDTRMTWADTSFTSPYGKIVSSWSAKPGEPFTMNVTIPANTSAYIYVPAKDENQVTEGGKPIDPASGLRFIKMEDGSAVYEAPSGTFHFEVK
jgi:alpha-L-rhamnosidase